MASTKYISRQEGSKNGQTRTPLSGVCVLYVIGKAILEVSSKLW